MELVDNLSATEKPNSSNNHDDLMEYFSNEISFCDDQQQTQVFMNCFSGANTSQISVPSSHNLNSSPFLVDNSNIDLTADFGNKKKQQKPLTERKRKQNVGKDVDKPKEVIHVRAKRGQATDSHSLAERVRREKINEKLKFLQTLVPGCYKTMGMAVMLDVVISYVQSLQNQIEFLSMKLSAASMYYDFNSPGMDAIDPNPMQGPNAYHEVQEMEKMLEEGHGGVSFLFC